jgi:NAD(P)-dependent dehydrogenase (short-subunit alcohol dehydrogenase family)
MNGVRAMLVTGASTGIGHAAALRLAEAGFAVFAGVRKENDARDKDAPKTSPRRSPSFAGAACRCTVFNNARIAVGGPLELRIPL